MIDVTVINREQLTEQVVRLQLAAKNAESLPKYQAGAHIDVHLPNGLIRQYSLCTPIGSDYYEIAVLNDANSRGGSKAMHKLIKLGDTLTISEPNNHFPLVSGARKTLLFAAGIGITPILAMAEQLAATQQDFELYFCSRSQALTPYLARIEQSSWADKAHFHFTNGDSANRLNVEPLLVNAQSDNHLYVCGPVSFIEDILSKALQAGWANEQLHREYFSAAPIDHTDDQSFEILINSSGQVLNVPADCSILNVLEDNGIFIPVACEEGVCGTCVTGLLEGQADHKDVFLTDEEKQQMQKITPCCSRSKSPRLVLDL
ncbi:PDR/VanB family oxidoreductase [Aliiglaciecola sp. LCG003]|uniref:PDR/VanB family oxidoreductase n=1 Tax=Aliiglaciecola sp. LCG003 TaxID=3053655 RepID=UPI0025732EE0|nr:PDR/VanB family oxidoreductase [Aliiglaciecola sp. LCG003]WJG09567.1 PDR/VanB family oxidoreductase [Aliiglaciecola sp. LCG003]